MSSTTPAAIFAAKTRQPQRGTRQTERERLQSRLEAAKINGGASAATARGNDRYTVEGRSGTRYTVWVADLETLYCDCKAGIHHGPSSCWHAGSVWLRLVADRAAGAV